MGLRQPVLGTGRIFFQFHHFHEFRSWTVATLTRDILERRLEARIDHLQRSRWSHTLCQHVRHRDQRFDRITDRRELGDHTAQVHRVGTGDRREETDRELRVRDDPPAPIRRIRRPLEDERISQAHRQTAPRRHPRPQQIDRRPLPQIERPVLIVVEVVQVPVPFRRRIDREAHLGLDNDPLQAVTLIPQDAAQLDEARKHGNRRNLHDTSCNTK